MRKKYLITFTIIATIIISFATVNIFAGNDDEEFEKAQMPFVVFDETVENIPFIPSGYMGSDGDIKNIEMELLCTDNPKSGSVCIKASFNSSKGWGGVVWQNPADDWGDKPGGYNLSAAKYLTFWARGKNGREKVTFKYGLIGKEKDFPDSGNGEKTIKLKKKWRKYKIRLKKREMKCIKTGFCWVVKKPGKYVTFYLDKIQYE